MYFYCYYVFLLYAFLLLCMLCSVYCFYCANRHYSATLTEVFPCFFLGCKANARVKLAKTGHGPHSSQIVLFYVLFVCKWSVDPIAVNKYIYLSIMSHFHINDTKLGATLPTGRVTGNSATCWEVMEHPDHSPHFVPTDFPHVQQDEDT